ncbi:MAG TPA: HPF/RaiA family ribosome-associated protein [Usitatibacter sp.]|nr:HPF/RaiA family ribosome-associated protein [Usitatibacter sp.]
MQVPLQITFRNIDRSDALETRIRADASKLERFHPRITRCRVTIEETLRHHSQGRQFAVAIEVRVPGKDLSALKDDEDVYVAVRDGFVAMRRQLEDLAKETRLA